MVDGNNYGNQLPRANIEIGSISVERNGTTRANVGSAISCVAFAIAASDTLFSK